MAFHVRFTVGARDDLRAIHDYIAENESREQADYVARGIVRAAMALTTSPNRGAHPPELLALGSRAYRQVFFKPYRVLYRVRGDTVFVAVIADGRREMNALLARRLKPD